MMTQHPSKPFTHFRANGLMWRITIRAHDDGRGFRVWGRADVTSGFFEQEFRTANVEFCNA